MDLLVIELRENGLVAARFRRGRGSLNLMQVEEQPYSDLGQRQTALLALAPLASGVGRIIAAVPPSMVSLRRVDLPLKDRRKLREVLPLELAGELTIDPEAAVFDVALLADGGQLAVWAPREDLVGLLEDLQGAGLDAEFLTVAPFSFSELLPEDARLGATAVVADDAIVMFAEGKQIFYRFLGQAVAKEESDRTLALLELEHGAIDKRFGLAAASAYPLLPLPGELLAIAPGELRYPIGRLWAVAKAATGAAIINFRHGPLAHTARNAVVRKQLLISIILAAVMLLLVFVEAGVRYFQVRRDVASLDASIGLIYRQVFPTRKKPVDEVAELKAELRRLGGPAGNTSALALLRGVAERKGKEISSIYEVELDDGRVRLKGDARSVQAVNGFRQQLAGMLDPVEVAEMRTVSDGNVSFVIRGVMKGEAR